MIEHKDTILAQFKCHQTGNCCRFDGVVYASAQEIEAMAKVLGIDIVSFMEKYVKRKDGWMLIADRAHRPNCFLNEKNQCEIYDARPKNCKTYPNWPEIWRDEESLYKETLLCKGLREAVQKQASR